jgi:predicted nucleotidyltransferase
MWTDTTRKKHARKGLRYSSDLTDAEWAGADSDIDLIADLDRPLGLHFFTLQDELRERLGARVDLVTEAALAPDIRFIALRDAVDA